MKDHSTLQEATHNPRRRFGLWLALCALWMAALAAAAAVDVRSAQWVREHRPVDKRSWAVKVWKSPGNFLQFTLPLAAVLALAHAWRWRASLLVCASGALGGAVYLVVKWIVGRTRPGIGGFGAFDFRPFRDGLYGFVHADNQSFPSGHACLAFATAAALAIAIPRWWWAFYILAAFVAAERVLEGAHYPSDAIAGAGFGVISAAVAWTLLKRPLSLSNSELGTRNSKLTHPHG